MHSLPAFSPVPALPLRAAGPLDGRTILRFAHAFETGGGTERYLDDLDRALLARNAATVIRLHLTHRSTPDEPRSDPIGRGHLIQVPLPVHGSAAGPHAGGANRMRDWLKLAVRDWLLYPAPVWRTVGARWVSRRPLPRRPGEALGAGAAAEAWLRRGRIDLAMLHFCGGSDADEVIAAMRRARVPVAILNHYSNTRFLNLPVRRHAMAAAAVAGVSQPHLPRYLRHGFTNLSDGIDVDYFHPGQARRPTGVPPYPVILLPARIVREKGQLDLVATLAELRSTGVACGLAFAGRTDASGFFSELRREITRLNLVEHVQFLGAIPVERLRDWYAASAVVALPTRHDEGLPRIVLEAQAMGTPVVAYATGGVADGIIPDVTGYLIRTGDRRSLTARLREILTSPALRTRLGENGRRIACERFSLPALAARHEEFYLRAMSPTRRAQSPA